MRPTGLRIRGLHSFRAAESVDLQALSADGLFGVFGPTGAGKSSLLDAITLALYGQVDRARYGTQGILNQLEDRLEVSFSFELRGPDGPRAYRVERRYARGKDSATAVRSGPCRLLGPDGAVLADRSDRVTDAVADLLGLTAEDFTRAVVLPQGRFAEFLRLKAADRRAMLQRLFGLERYGATLSERVRHGLEAVEPELRGAEGEQAGLGDAAAGAVTAAEAAVAAAAREVAAAETEVGRARADWEAWEQVWRWQQELGQVAGAEAAHAAEAGSAQAAAAELDAASRAEAIRPYLEATQSAAADSHDAAARLPVAAGERESAQAAGAAAAQTREAARTRRREEQPGLLRRRGELEVATELERELQDLAAAQAEAEDACADAGAARGEAEAAWQQAAAAQQELVEAQRADALRLQAVAVSPERRERVARALQALLELRRAAEAVSAARAGRDLAQAGAAAADGRSAAALAALAAADGARGEAAAARADWEASPPQGEGELAAAAADLERARGAVGAFRSAQGRRDAAAAERRGACEATRSAKAALARASAAAAAADEALARAAAGETHARGQLRQAELQERAASVAASLQPGQPCPACGSTEHPHPAASGPADLQALSGELERVQAQLAEARTSAAAAGAAVAGAQARLLAAEAQMREVARRLAEAEAELTASARALPPTWDEGEALDLRLAAAERTLADRRSALERWAADLRALKAREQEGSAAALAAQQAAAALRAEAATAHGVLAARAAALDEAEAAAGAAGTRLAALEGGWSEAGVQEQADQVADADRQAHEISERLTQHARAVERARATLAAAEELRLRCQQAEQIAQHAAFDLRERGASLARRLEASTHGEPAGSLAAQVTVALARLEEEEQAAERAVADAEARLGAAFAAEHAARQQEAASARRLAEARARLARALREGGFGLEATALGCLRTAVERDALEGRVRRHREEGIRLRERRRGLEAQLAGRSVDEAAWQALRQVLTMGEQRVEAGQQALGGARMALEDVRARHARWQALEARRRDLARQRDELADLQAVLRGSAFVEFLAEEQLASVARHASERLVRLTRGRYALEASPEEGFIIRDDHNGGIRRPVGSLSGGETFLAALALALALSTHIQLRGRYPLEFFFLDEGFGSLDPQALDTVLDALERLRDERLVIGVISHLPEVRARMPRRIVVEPAEPGGAGSRLRVEVA